MAKHVEALAVDTTRNSTDNVRSQVRSQVTAGTSFHPQRNPMVSHQKSIDQIMPIMNGPFTSLRFSFLANACKINPVYYINYDIITMTSKFNLKHRTKQKPKFVFNFHVQYLTTNYAAVKRVTSTIQYWFQFSYPIITNHAYVMCNEH